MMSAAALPSESAARAKATDAAALLAIRQVGGVDIGFERRGGKTIAADFGESGGYRVRLPDSEHGLEAALLNTGGGMAGGDRVAHTVTARRGASALVTTTSAERVYRTLGAQTGVSVRLTVERDAHLIWLPQETLLYDGAALDRQLAADVEPDAILTILDMTVFGRVASGETLQDAALRDTWRIRRGGQLVFAENLRLDGNIAEAMQRPAIGGTARVLATLLYVAKDAGERLGEVRTCLEAAAAEQDGIEAGASTWNDLLVVRTLGTTLKATRACIARVAPLLMQRPMPRLWWS